MSPPTRSTTLDLQRVAIVMRSADTGGHSIEQVFSNHAKHIDGVTLDFVELAAGESKWFHFKRLMDYPLIHVTGHVNWVITCLFWKRSVLTVHDIGRLRELQGLRKWVYYLWWMGLPCFFANRITVVSEYTAEQLTSICPFARKRIEVVYNSVPEGFKFSPRPVNVIPIVLQVGTAIHKNAEGTIAALEGMNVQLVLIGKPREELTRLLREKKIAHQWITNVSYAEVLDQYHQCDVVVFPSFHEGFGLPVMEAQAVGRPVVTSRVCSLPEVGGEGAIYVNPHSTPEIREAIRSLLDDRDLWEMTVKRGNENLSRFDPRKIAGQLANIYREFLGTASSL